MIEESSVVIPSAATWKPEKNEKIEHEISNERPIAAKVETEDNIEENVEHLHLTLQEAFFLIWSLDCLILIDPTTVRITHIVAMTI